MDEDFNKAQYDAKKQGGDLLNLGGSSKRQSKNSSQLSSRTLNPSWSSGSLQLQTSLKRMMMNAKDQEEVESERPNSAGKLSLPSEMGPTCDSARVHMISEQSRQTPYNITNKSEQGKLPPITMSAKLNQNIAVDFDEN